MASCKTAVSPGHNTLWILQSCAKPSYSISFQFKVAFMWFRIQNHPPNSKQRATNNWPLNVIIIKHVLWCLLKKDLLEIYLNYLKDLVFCTTRSPSETFRGMELWCFPCTCCLTGLNCNNVTNGSGLQVCNNVTSGSAICNNVTSGSFICNNVTSGSVMKLTSLSVGMVSAIWSQMNDTVILYIDGLVQERRNSIGNATPLVTYLSNIFLALTYPYIIIQSLPFVWCSIHFNRVHITHETYLLQL